MRANSGWTPSEEENLLHLTDRAAINEQEAIGMALAELYMLQLPVTVSISTELILDIHRVAFGHLYDWAGKWRNTNIVVGQLAPPEPTRLVQLMYQFADNLNYKVSVSQTREEQIECLIYAHYEFVRIHPFNNGNGRMGRVLLNLVAVKFGYQPLELYHRAGESRGAYISAMRAADKGDAKLLRSLITAELTPL